MVLGAVHHEWPWLMVRRHIDYLYLDFVWFVPYSRQEIECSASGMFVCVYVSALFGICKNPEF